MITHGIFVGLEAKSGNPRGDAGSMRVKATKNNIRLARAVSMCPLAIIIPPTAESYRLE